MDRIALEILVAELRQDAAVMTDAAQQAKARLEEEHPGHLEACGYELNRLYNILEKAFERLCIAFENQFDKTGDYHDRLIDRVSLDIPDVRPAFLPQRERYPVRELNAFRHVFRHAYDLKFRRNRLVELVELAQRVATDFPRWIEAFAGQVRPSLEDE